MEWIGAIARWLHFFFGVMWIGLLYYFNFVQAQALAQANAEGIGQGISKFVLPRALFFFRWAAVWTWVAGAILLESLGGFGHGAFLKAFTFQNPYTGIGIGAWLGTIMLINVWTFIWQNQKKVLGITPVTDEEKAKARRIAFLASRVNTMLSIPMLWFMATGFSHRI
jgi:uncharacterized membrane protein